jgi:hypothetical protein
MANILDELANLGVIGDIDLTPSYPKGEAPAKTSPIEVEEAEDYENFVLTEDSDTISQMANLCERAASRLDIFSKMTEDLRDLFMDMKVAWEELSDHEEEVSDEEESGDVEEEEDNDGNGIQA